MKNYKDRISNFARKNNMAIEVFNYDENRVAFDVNGQIMVNATQMAKPFGKRPDDFLKTQYIKEFIQVLSVTKKIVTADLLKVTKGGNPDEQGTWMHEDLAFEFARWLSPKFGIWCNDRIKEILKQQYTLNNEQIKSKLISGEIRFSMDEIKGLNGGRHCLMPSDFWTKDGYTWQYTDFHVNEHTEAIITAVDKNGNNWFNLPQLLRFIGFDDSATNGFVRSSSAFLRQLSPFNKAYKRYFCDEKMVKHIGFGENNTLQISQDRYNRKFDIQNFEQRLLSIINQVKTIEEKEFLIDLYKIFK